MTRGKTPERKEGLLNKILMANEFSVKTKKSRLGLGTVYSTLSPSGTANNALLHQQFTPASYMIRL